VVNQRWCKGCGICVTFCPTKILELKSDKICVTDEDKCIYCGQCELRCPDYAIYLEEVQDDEA
jgi:2-oxoglutarate ferredoxin oxidoreductase subunit delta